MTINWASLGIVAAFSLVIGVLVVVLVSDLTPAEREHMVRLN